MHSAENRVSDRDDVDHDESSSVENLSLRVNCGSGLSATAKRLCGMGERGVGGGKVSISAFLDLV